MHKTIRPLILAALLVTVGSAMAQQADTENASVPPSFLQRAATSAQGVVASTSDNLAQILDKGFGFLGIRYRIGGTGPEAGGFDCSGLVKKVFGDAIGVNLPRTAAEMASVGDKVGKDDLKPGDLVFFNTMRRTFSHVGIYVGDNKFLHAPSAGGVVRVDNMDAEYWVKRFTGARRLVPDASAASLPNEKSSLNLER